MQEKEIWKKIQEYPWYSISSLWRMRSDGFFRENWSGGYTQPVKILSPSENWSWYLKIPLTRYRKTVYLHRIVAQCFLRNSENKLQVNHKNGIRTDNRLENLEWVTCSENHKHSYRELGRVHSRNTKSVINISTWNAYESIILASISTWADPSGITKCCKWKIKTAGGFNWKYA